MSTPAASSTPAPTPGALADQLTRAANNLLAHSAEAELTGKRELPTPCSEYNVHQLCEHLLGTLVMSTHAAAKQPLPADAPLTLTSAPWQPYPPLAEELGKAWAAPEAWAGETPFGPSTYPALFAGMVTILELTVHGWDLAQATGQSFTADADVVATAAAVAEQIATEARAGGAFGPEVPAAADAPALDRLLAFTGRRPVA